MTTHAVLTPPSLLSLLRVEMRKTADTRSGRWLLGILALLSIAVVTLLLVFGERTEQNFEGFFLSSQLPLGVFLPDLGIIAVTGEWSQRTTLSNFTLVPRRKRIVAAKVLALVAVALLAVIVSVVAAGIGNVLAQLTSDAEGSWGSASMLGYAALFQVISVMIGVGLGLLLLNATLAIVAYLLLPVVVSTVASFATVLETPVLWVNFLESTPMLLGEELTGSIWAKIATSFATWALLPLALGTLRIERREVA